MKLPFSLPVPLNRNFLGRATELKRLHDLLTQIPEMDSQSGVAVLHGLGGAGKTQLSIAYASSHRHEFDAVIWVDGTDQTSTFSSYQVILRRFLDALGDTGDNSTALRSKLEAAQQLTSSTGRTCTNKEALSKVAATVIDALQSDDETFTWLMIVDNVDNLSDYPLATFLPQSERGKIIITTRLKPVTKFGHPIEVGEIADGNAVKILLKNACLRQKTPSGNQHLFAGKCEHKSLTRHGPGRRRRCKGPSKSLGISPPRPRACGIIHPRDPDISITVPATP